MDWKSKWVNFTYIDMTPKFQQVSGQTYQQTEGTDRQTHRQTNWQSNSNITNPPTLINLFWSRNYSIRFWLRVNLKMWFLYKLYKIAGLVFDAKQSRYPCTLSIMWKFVQSINKYHQLLQSRGTNIRTKITHHEILDYLYPLTKSSDQMQMTLELFGGLSFHLRHCRPSDLEHQVGCK